MWDQSTGYLGLRWDSQDNAKLLADENFPKKHKRKIKLIENYKTWFFDFFNREHTDIYSKTTILKTKAVTHLVIASRYNEIKPKQFSFWFVGEFPYIGFFDKEKADAFEKGLQKEDYVTYQRPVYAFSTLNRFEDPILSSFFYYNDYQLAGLIFHELFHTIFFVKDDVELNENLAQFFASELLKIYFKDDSLKLEEGKRDSQYSDRLRSYLKAAADELQQRYSKLKSEKKEDFLQLKQEFIAQSLMPKLETLCDDYKINRKRCYSLKGEWNNARLAAFLSYEKDVDFFADHFKKSKLSLIEYYQKLVNEYEIYDDKDLEVSFVDYLKKREA